MKHPTETIFLWPLGWSFKTGFTVPVNITNILPVSAWPSSLNFGAGESSEKASIVWSLLPVRIKPWGKASSGGSTQTQDTKLLCPLISWPHVKDKSPLEQTTWCKRSATWKSGHGPQKRKSIQWSHYLRPPMGPCKYGFILQVVLKYKIQ